MIRDLMTNDQKYMNMEPKCTAALLAIKGILHI
jgi:hypothetical protein